MLAKKILIVDDEQTVRRVITQALFDWKFVPVEAESIGTALRLFDSEQPALTLLDINLPDGSGLNLLRTIKRRQPNAVVIIASANVSVENMIAALRAGASDFISKPIDLEELQTAIRNGFKVEESHSNSSHSLQVDSNYFNFEQIIGESAEIKELVSLARKVAENDVSSVLLQGESGTGKDLIARAIHNASVRSNQPFVTINCAALPANLIESELFGFEKGAFTDAKAAKQGLFEQAKGGTIFLDEIGELELGLQAKLLRVLEARVFRRVGGLKDLPLQSSVITASNRNLREESETGNFRRDLYFRLSVIELNVPPLRVRGDDVLLLADHFIETLDRSKHSAPKSRRLAPETIRAFRLYHWVGNVRELRNVIERALILEESELITLDYLPPALSCYRNNAANRFSEPIGGKLPIYLPLAGISLEEVKDSLIEQAMQRAGGNITRAAETLNISRDRMRYYLKKKRIEKSDKLSTS